MIYVHPTSVFNLAAQGLIIIAHHVKDWKAILKAFAPMVLAFLSFVAWVVAIPYFERNDTMWFDAPDWEAIKYVLLVFYANSKLLILQLILLAITFVLLIRFKKRNSFNQFGSLIIWCGVPFVLSILFSHLIKPVFQDKYILSVQPAMMLLLAFSIYQLRYKLLRLTGFVLAGIFMLSSMDLTLNPEGDWRNAIEYLKNEQTKNKSAILLEPWYEFRTFSYYYDRTSYENPDTTFKSLIKQHVFTSWHDVYDTLKLEPKFDLFHSVVAHEGLNALARDERVLEKNATLVEERKYIGINVETYALHRNIYGSDEYSISRALRLKDVYSSSDLSITVAVDIMQHQTLEGVLLITSVENEQGESIFYGSKPVVEGVFENETLHVQEEIQLSEFKKDWIVKAYLRNTEQCSFQYKGLAIKTN